MRIATRVLTLFLLAGAVLLSTVLVPSAPSFSETGATIFLPYVPRDYSYSTVTFPLGVQLDLQNTQGAALARDAGAGWVRESMSWSDVEPSNTTPESFNWSAYDTKFLTASSNGLRLLVNLSSNPSWAASTSCGPIDMVSLQEYISFVEAAVIRYSQAPYNIHYWEIFNEPDNTDVTRAWLGGCFGNQGITYANTLKAIYPAVKAADPQSQVVLGSLAYDWFTSWAPPGPFNQSFIEDVLDPARGNAGAYFDIFAFHYYPAWRGAWEAYGTDVIGKTNYLKNILSRYNLSKPMAVTEINQWNKSAGSGGSDEEQGAYVVQAYARSMAAGLAFSIWYCMTDYNEWGYGLLNSDLTKKPSYTVYQTLTSAMSGATYSGPLLIGGVAPSNIEGYTFTMPSGRQRHVLWATTNSGETLTFPASSQLTLTSKSGAATRLDDGTDGAWDNAINIAVTKSPVYLDVQ